MSWFFFLFSGNTRNQKKRYIEPEKVAGDKYNRTKAKCLVKEKCMNNITEIGKFRKSSKHREAVSVNENTYLKELQ